MYALGVASRPPNRRGDLGAGQDEEDEVLRADRVSDLAVGASSLPRLSATLSANLCCLVTTLLADVEICSRHVAAGISACRERQARS